MTIGCNCNFLHFDIGASRVTLNVWDTAGQEIYRSIVPFYMRDTAAALLVYDITDEKSFEALDSWVSLLQDETSNVYVVANKLDLKHRRTIDDDQGLLYAEGCNAKFFKVSAIEGTGIQAMFKQIATELCRRPRIGPRLLGSDGKAGECC
jgi:small GTP-binding protein